MSKVMSLKIQVFWLVLALAAQLSGACLWAQPSPAKVQIRVKMPPISSQGHLLVFLTKATRKQQGLTAFGDEPGDGNAVAALELGTTAAESTVVVDLEGHAYPVPFSIMPAGDYVLQALLDVAGTYGQSGPTTFDWVSAEVPVKLPFTEDLPSLKLTEHPAPRPWDGRATAALATGNIEEFRIASPLLTRFYGSETAITGSVVLPAGLRQEIEVDLPNGLLELRLQRFTFVRHLLRNAHP